MEENYRKEKEVQSKELSDMKSSYEETLDQLRSEHKERLAKVSKQVNLLKERLEKT
jgi:hypothetical protein